MSWCTNGDGLQVLPFMDNRHLGSIPHFQLSLVDQGRLLYIIYCW